MIPSISFGRIYLYFLLDKLPHFSLFTKFIYEIIPSFLIKLLSHLLLFHIVQVVLMGFVCFLSDLNFLVDS